MELINVLGIGRETGTENDGAGWAIVEFSTRGVTGAVSPPGKH